jgi:sensor histidine kinase YesM
MRYKGLPYIVIGLFSIFISAIRVFLIPEWNMFIHVVVLFIQFLFLTFVWWLIVKFSDVLDKYIPFGSQVGKRIAIQILFSLMIISPVFIIILTYYQNYLPPYVTPQFIAIMLVLLILFTVLINFIFYFRYTFQQWERSVKENARLQVQTAQLEKDRLMMQYHHLKNQVNPHFLFNTLTSLDGLIQTNAELASDFVRHLAKVYRYVLDHRENEVVSVQTELDFIEHYVSLLKIRYKNALQINIKVSEEAREKGIVMVTLQMLIDNAIKHNMVQERSPLIINIWDENNRLHICNNKQLKRSIELSSKQGLQQLEQLYNILNKESVTIKNEQDFFEVNLPLL